MMIYLYTGRHLVAAKAYAIQRDVDRVIDAPLLRHELSLLSTSTDETTTTTTSGGGLQKGDIAGVYYKLYALPSLLDKGGGASSSSIALSLRQAYDSNIGSSKEHEGESEILKVKGR